MATEMLQLLNIVKAANLERSGRCVSCGYPQQICRQAKYRSLKDEEACHCEKAAKKKGSRGAAYGPRWRARKNAVSRNYYGLARLRERKSLQMDGGAGWLLGIKVPRTMMIFQKLDDGHDGITRTIDSRV